MIPLWRQLSRVAGLYRVDHRADQLVAVAAWIRVVIRLDRRHRSSRHNPDLQLVACDGMLATTALLDVRGTAGERQGNVNPCGPGAVGRDRDIKGCDDDVADL